MEGRMAAFSGRNQAHAGNDEGLRAGPKVFLYLD
jgi:hypothetical protein